MVIKNQAVTKDLMFKSPPFIDGTNFSKEEIDNAKKQNRLLSITLLLSNACNLKCKYCYRDAGKPFHHTFTINEWKDILLQAKELGARSVWIPGSGEPFLDPSFFNGQTFPLLELCCELDLSVAFFTNGTQITEESVSQLSNLGISVITKLNSFVPETQDYLTGIKNSYKEIRKGLDLLIEAGLAEKIPSHLAIDTVIVRQNYLEIPSIFEFCRDHNIIPYITANLHGGRACDNDILDIPLNQLQSLFEELLDIDQKKYGYSWFPSPPVVGSQCKRLLYDIVVEATGKVLLCPGIDIEIGNLHCNTLETIVNSSQLLKKIRNLPQTIKGACNNCQSDNCVYGCRLEAFANGDLFGEDPMCWYQKIGNVSEVTHQ